MMESRLGLSKDVNKMSRGPANRKGACRPDMENGCVQKLLLFIWTMIVNEHTKVKMRTPHEEAAVRFAEHQNATGHYFTTEQAMSLFHRVSAKQESMEGHSVLRARRPNAWPYIWPTEPMYGVFRGLLPYSIWPYIYGPAWPFEEHHSPPALHTDPRLRPGTKLRYGINTTVRRVCGQKKGTGRQRLHQHSVHLEGVNIDIPWKSGALRTHCERGRRRC